MDAALDSPAAPAPPWKPAPWKPAPWPPARDLVVDNLRRQADKLGPALTAIGRPAATLRHVRAAWPAMRELVAEEPGPRTSLDRLVGPGRTLAIIRSSLDLVKEIAHAHEATVNDVLLAVTAGGLRDLLRSRGESVEKVILPIYVPVSVRRDRPGQEGGNLISQMVVHLLLGNGDPGYTLRQIAAETRSRKAIARPSLGTMFRSRVASRAMLKLIIRQRVNVTSADVPGPQTPLCFAGARLLEVFPLLNLVGNVSLGVGALSYAGQFNVMAVGDADACPDIDVFAASARDEFRALAGSAALP